MSGIYFVGACYDIEAGNDYLAVPYDRFSRLVESAVASVAIRTLGNTLNTTVLIDAGNSILGEIGYPDISVVIDTHPVGGA